MSELACGSVPDRPGEDMLMSSLLI